MRLTSYTFRASDATMYAVKFAEAPQPSDVSRHLVEQLNAFVIKLDASLSSAVTSLGDALKALVKIKTELLNEASRFVSPSLGTSPNQKHTWHYRNYE